MTNKNFRRFSSAWFQHTQESFVGFLRTQSEPARVVGGESTGMFREEKQKKSIFRSVRLPFPTDDRSVIALSFVFFFLVVGKRPWPSHSI